jgi:hypothetical protein
MTWRPMLGEFANPDNNRARFAGDWLWPGQDYLAPVPPRPDLALPGMISMWWIRTSDWAFIDLNHAIPMPKKRYPWTS